MSRARNWLVFSAVTAVVAQGVVGMALAQGGGAQPGPDLFPPEAQASPPPTVKVLTMEEADKLSTEMNELVAGVEKLDAVTRKKGDEIQIICVSDKFAKLQKVQAGTEAQLAGVAKPETRLQASGDLQKSHTETVSLHRDAFACVGQDGDAEVVDEDGIIIVDEGGGGPGDDDGTGTGFGGLPSDPLLVNPPVVSSPTG